MSENRTKILECARRIAFLWKDADAGRDALTETYGSMVPELDTLLQLISEPEQHKVNSRKVIERGRAENGYQPETEFTWYCSCRPGKSSGDMGSMSSARIAADKHFADPMQFDGWLE